MSCHFKQPFITLVQEPAYLRETFARFISFSWTIWL